MGKKKIKAWTRINVPLTSHNANRVKALSWTLDSEKAEWFAHRFDEDGAVYEAKIDKAHVYAFFSSRNESEVIVDPAFLRELTEVQELDMDLSMTM